MRLTSNFAKNFSEIELEALASMDTIAMGVKTVGLWSLTEHRGMNLPEKDQVRSLDDLSGVELTSRLSSIRRGLDLLRRHGVEVITQGAFIEALEHRVRAHA